MDAMLGSIMLFSGSYAPRGWMACAGQMLQISQYEALFSILGTTYGGDGQRTFALPKMDPPASNALPGQGLRWIICVMGEYPCRE